MLLYIQYKQLEKSMKMLRAHWQFPAAFLVIATLAVLFAQRQAEQGCRTDTAAVKEGRLPAATIEGCN